MSAQDTLGAHLERIEAQLASIVDDAPFYSRWLVRRLVRPLQAEVAAIRQRNMDALARAWELGV